MMDREAALRLLAKHRTAENEISLSTPPASSPAAATRI